MGNRLHDIKDNIGYFIRRYYFNLLIKGALLFLAIGLSVFLLAVSSEFFMQMDRLIRALLFYVVISIYAYIFIAYILIPVLQIFRIGRVISDEYAARIIGKHFPEIDDKLINVLQLERKDEYTDEQVDLLIAGIEQKSKGFIHLDFRKAVDINKNRKYIKWVIVPVVFLLVLLFSAPNFIVEPADRLVHHNREFEKLFPFVVQIDNENLKGIMHEDFELRLSVSGKEIPDKIFIETDKGAYLAKSYEKLKYRHIFRNIAEEISFRLIAGRWKSKVYTIRVLPKPIILSFDAFIDYPSYIGKDDELLENTGDLIVAVGSRISWKFYTKDVKKLIFGEESTTYFIEKLKENVFFRMERILHSFDYFILASNEYLISPDSLRYSVSVIPDAYPDIFVTEYRDSLFNARIFFTGNIKDDYGFTKLKFRYRLLNDSMNDDSFNENEISISEINEQRFFYTIDGETFNLSHGEGFEYYFIVWDNDAINGYKPSKTQKMIYRLPDRVELNNSEKEFERTIMDDLEKAKQEAKKLNEDIEKLNRELIDKKTLSFQEKEKIEELIKRNKELEKRIENINQLNEIKNLEESGFREHNERIIEKQKQLQELFEKVMDEETMKLMEELERLMEELDKDNINKMMEKMKLSNEDIERELDRNLELFKQLEFEKQLEENIDKLDEMIKQQEETKELTDEKEFDKALKKQEELSKDLEELDKGLKEMEKMNNELEEKNELPGLDQEMKRADEEMQESTEGLKSKMSNNASQHQQQSRKELEKMKQKLEDAQQSMMQQQIGEDAEMLREILENLLELSFMQEELMNRLNTTDKNDPRFTEIVKKQHEVKDGLEMVEDSLMALSKRQLMIKGIINKEINIINHNLEKAIEILLQYHGKTGHRNQKANAASRQQFVMTSINNLALLLNESLEQMMQEMSSMMQGNKKNCKKPKSGMSKMKSMSEMQQELNRQLEQMKRDMKEGKKPGKGKMGQSISERLARMAAQQEAIRKMMQEHIKDLKEQGKAGMGNLNKMMNEMELTEEDLVNKRITQETLERQQEILSRLLESEKAEREREKEERRKSEEAKQHDYSNPKEFLEYKRLIEQERELLKSIPQEFSDFYKRKINEYFYKIE